MQRISDECQVMEANGGEGSQELLQVQIRLWSHIQSFVDSMALRCAMELGIPDAIHSHGEPITLSKLAAAISVPAAKTGALWRLMRLLVHSGFFAQDTSGGEDVYLLTASSGYLLKAKDVCLSPFLLLLVDRMTVDSLYSLTDWFKETKERSVFELAHGIHEWQIANQNPDYNSFMNKAFASESSFTTKLIMKGCGEIFHGLKSLVDVGGGTGTMARAIAQAFPQVKCTVFDLPHVVASLPETKTIGAVGGDMFESIPPAHAILLKKVLHDWSDEDCVKILRRCKEAVPSREDGGKVIVIEMVVMTDNSNPELTRAQLLTDMLMMTQTTGKERNEDEWRKIFADAGFTGYEIKHMLGLQAIMVAYP